MNKYDLEHICTAHSRMTEQEWHGAYHRAWLQYYSMEHVETLLRRAIADNVPVKRLMHSIVVFLGMPMIECIHPLQGGYLRLKVRGSRRSGLKLEPALLFYPRYAAETAVKAIRFVALLRRINRLRKRRAARARRAPLQRYRDRQAARGDRGSVRDAARAAEGGGGVGGIVQRATAGPSSATQGRGGLSQKERR